ncbi:hypothetical protein [Thiomonas sp. FB-Cd]|nr:hypothetical protein [Thiomonas sp. FB-Cd]
MIHTALHIHAGCVGAAVVRSAAAPVDEAGLDTPAALVRRASASDAGAV